MEDNKIMTDEEIEAVVNAASEAVSEDVNDIRNINPYILDTIFPLHHFFL